MRGRGWAWCTKRTWNARLGLSALLVLATVWTAACGAAWGRDRSPDVRQSPNRQERVGSLDAGGGCVFVRSAQGVVTSIAETGTVVLDDGREVTLQALLLPSRSDLVGTIEAWPIEEEALRALRRALVGKNVRVVEAGGRRDRYGRRDAHVWLLGPSQEPVWIQKVALSLGWARFAPVAERSACAEQLVEAESMARQEAVGLWALDAYRVRPAEAPLDLMRLQGTYQIVRGRVRAAATVRGRLYLNFDDDFRRDFTAVISAKQLKFFEGSGIDPSQLTGALVEVRGWIERRGGPMIEIEHTHQVRRVEEREGAGLALERDGDGSRRPRAPAAPRRSQPRPERPVPAPPAAAETRGLDI
ncbi:MAG: thermonuclease family protein [Hyphomicrobiaceae bacterium]